MDWMLEFAPYGVVAAILVYLAASDLVRAIFLAIIRHPLSKTQIEIHGKKDITVKST